jgi:hypothetical protein
MSWGTCYSGSNNIHFDYPALMSDGSYTDWNPSCAVNNQHISFVEHKNTNLILNQNITVDIYTNPVKIIIDHMVMKPVI